MSCRLLTRSPLASSLETRITYLRSSPALSLRALVPSRGQTALHRPAPSGSGPVTGHPVTSRSDRADSEYRWPTWFRPTWIRFRSHPCSAQATRITGRTHGSGRLGSQRPVTSHDADPSNTAGLGCIPTARVHAPAGQAQSSRSPRLRTQQATEGIRRGYYDKAYVGARLKLFVQRTLELNYTGCESHTMVWRPQFGTQRRPVGGPAGFEPHRHRTATCPHTCGSTCPTTYISEPRPKAQVAERKAINCAFTKASSKALLSFLFSSLIKVN